MYMLPDFQSPSFLSKFVQERYVLTVIGKAQYVVSGGQDESLQLVPVHHVGFRVHHLSGRGPFRAGNSQRHRSEDAACARQESEGNPDSRSRVIPILDNVMMIFLVFRWIVTICEV